ncbi:hypothetical protein Q5P01_008567 [Channa striata]|uniref:Uncharacterized protein n=1 Tax=Channa striata TaxID=64152 RepID=A0AA88SU59_CHASR|nr:hypothetical protein Q5P01_008567 [Channa striata]
MDEQSAAGGQHDDRYVRNHRERNAFRVPACKDPSDIFKRLKMSRFKSEHTAPLNAALIITKAEFWSSTESTARKSSFKKNFLTNTYCELQSHLALGPSEKPRLNPFPVARLRQQHARQRKDKGAAAERSLSAPSEKRQKENTSRDDLCIYTLTAQIWKHSQRQICVMDFLLSIRIPMLCLASFTPTVPPSFPTSLCSAVVNLEGEVDLAGQAFPAAQCRDLLIGPSAFLADLAESRRANWPFRFTWKGEEGFREE